MFNALVYTISRPYERTVVIIVILEARKYNVRIVPHVILPVERKVSPSFPVAGVALVAGIKKHRYTPSLVPFPTGATPQKTGHVIQDPIESVLKKKKWNRVSV